MMISTKGRYAMRLMVDIALHAEKTPTSLKEIGMREEMPVKYLEQLVRPLTKANLLKSVRGQCGGYLLARPACAITAGDIIRAAEGTTAPVACLGGTGCPRASLCPTLPFWRGLDEAIESYVDSVTLADLAFGASDQASDMRFDDETAHALDPVVTPV
ncbi:MAG: RrF2 family transcriptional regulator [Slackia sp.]|nr:RrF2 family transcriptional regulator [Slackia sp.]